MNTIRDDEGAIRTNTKEIHGIIIAYLKSLQDQDQIHNLNRPIAYSEVEVVFKSIPTKKKLNK